MKKKIEMSEWVDEEREPKIYEKYLELRFYVIFT